MGKGRRQSGLAHAGEHKKLSLSDFGNHVLLTVEGGKHGVFKTGKAPVPEICRKVGFLLGGGDVEHAAGNSRHLSDFVVSFLNRKQRLKAGLSPFVELAQRPTGEKHAKPREADKNGNDDD